MITWGDRLARRRASIEYRHSPSMTGGDMGNNVAVRQAENDDCKLPGMLHDSAIFDLMQYITNPKSATHSSKDYPPNSMCNPV